jgi:DtxR family Mn-dependent transcriptional regulator
MTAPEWLRRWMGSPVPAHGWADDCPAGLPVPEAKSCAATGCDSVLLTTLLAGQRGCVTCLDQSSGPAVARLGALGLLPGIELEVVQQFPAFVLRMGYAEIAIDDALACAVRVRRV